MTTARPDGRSRPEDRADSDSTATVHSDRNGPVDLGDEEAVKRVLTDTVLGLWEIVGNLTRIRPARRERYRVTIFGSARLQSGSPAYDEVRRVAAALSELGCDIVTGGGPGLMQAANEGAVLAAERGRSVGIRVELPFEQDVNPFVEQAYEHRTFFTRLHHFVLASDCFVVAPGGIGTVLELTMIWQLLQVRHLRDVPLILVGRMWPELVDWARRHMTASTPPLANAEDMDIPQCVATADEAVEIIRRSHEHWRSK